MFDIKWVRENPDKFDQGLARRGVAPKAGEIIGLDGQRRQLISDTPTRTTESNVKTDW